MMGSGMPTFWENPLDWLKEIGYPIDPAKYEAVARYHMGSPDRNELLGQSMLNLLLGRKGYVK